MRGCSRSSKLARAASQLRLVAAGRAEAPELVAGTSTRRTEAVIKLEPLSHSESAEMVRRLGRSLLPTGWNDAWMHRLAGKSTDPPERREPLSLRVAVETLRDEAPANRDARSIEIEALGEDASTSFVGKLYMNRVVGHVAGGEDVRKLAWPGLVLRRVSCRSSRSYWRRPSASIPRARRRCSTRSRRSSGSWCATATR